MLKNKRSSHKVITQTDIMHKVTKTVWFYIIS